MATFAQVKAILDGLVAGRDPVSLRNRHGGNAFRWDTAACLRAATAQVFGTTYPLIDSAYVHNNRADETFLIRVLTNGIPEDGIDPMPYGGPIYASPQQVQVICDWINEGAQDDEETRTGLHECA